MALRHDETARSELDMKLKAGILTSATSAWSLPIVTATKRDGKKRFCVDFRNLNQIIKPLQLPLPKVQRFFGELPNGADSKPLYFFSRYCEIKMSEHCKGVSIWSLPI